MGIIEEEKRVSRLKEKFERLAIEQRCSESYGPSGGRERYVKTMPAYYRSYERTIESPGEKMKYERSYIKVSNKDKRSEIRSSSYFKSSLKNPYHIENIFDDENDITIPEINEESMNADRSPSNAAIKSFNDTASYHSDIFREDRYMDSSRYKNDTSNKKAKIILMIIKFNR